MIYHYLGEPPYQTEIDIPALFDNLDSLKKSHKKIRHIDQYIEDWKNVFYTTYVAEKNEHKVYSFGEHYYQTIYLFDTEMRLHFSVEPAKSLLKEYPVQTIPLTAFSENIEDHSNILYTHCQFDSISPKHDVPIILVPCNLRGFDYIVIDGNHRVSQAKAHNKDVISAILIEPSRAYSFIQSEFEKAVYLFLCEGFNIKYAVKNPATAYFVDGKFNIVSDGNLRVTKSSNVFAQLLSLLGFH